MFRALFLITLSFGLFLGLSNTASAHYYGLGYSRSYSYFPAPPKARYDDRIDQKLIHAAMIADRSSAAHTSLRCWKFVKLALLQAGAVSSYPSTNYAKQAGAELTSRYGFVRLSTRDPYHAPIGAVIVYGGRGAGHVELRTEHGFASDYHSTRRCRYPVIGVYARLSGETHLAGS